MLCVFPFHAGDVKLLANLLTWIRQLGTPKNHSTLLMADAGVDWNEVLKLKQLASESFTSVAVIANLTSVVGWPQGPNDLFLNAAVYAQFHNVGAWLFMETDAVPLRASWLDDLTAEYERLKTLFMGHIYAVSQPNLPAKCMSGVAVYPVNTRSLLDAHISPGMGVGFDVAMTPTVLKHGAHTELIQHFWGQPNLPPTFVSSKSGAPSNAFTLEMISPHARIFHRNKDGTLIKLLRERMGLRVPGTSQMPTRKTVTVRRTAALGDVLSATCVAQRLCEAGYRVRFQAHPSTHCILRRIPCIAEVSEPYDPVDINLDGAYEGDPMRRSKHFVQMFYDRAGKQFRGVDFSRPTNYAPRMILEDHERQAALNYFKPFPKPWIVICPRSHSWANRTVPDSTWVAVAQALPGTKFWSALHPAPTGIVDLNTRHFDKVIQYLAAADLLVTVDTGPMHVAAALGTPVVAIQQASSPELHLSDQKDFVMVSPPLNCLNCQIDLCPINPHMPPCQFISPQIIADAANLRLQATQGDGISAVICIYKPDVNKLNRCLRDVLPQVDEIVVVSDKAGFVPKLAMQHPKIRYIRLNQHDVGYGRKANYGFRHTNHRWVLLLNDDVYLAPDAVKLLKAQMAHDVGMVAHLLLYPDGTIQHGGTYRNPGDPGWGHLDHRARESRIKEPVEIENVCGASVLVRREAFYQAGGFDADFFLYCEDNALCLAVRQAGWKIRYTPHARGIHEESQSTSVTQGIHQIMLESQRIFTEKWGWYFTLNKNNRMGVFE